MRKYLLLVFLCGICLWVACKCVYSQINNTMDRQKRTVVDVSGKTVEIPRIVNRIVVTCQGGAAHEIAVLGAAHRIVAQPSMKSFPQLLKMYPCLNAVSDAGSFDVIDLERIMVLKPDIVVASVYSMQGNKKIEEMGIPVVTVNTGRADVDHLLKEFNMMGMILGKEKTANELMRYWNDRLAMIRKRTASIPEARKKRVFYTSSGASITTSMDRVLGWGHHFITASGGMNVSVSGNIKIEKGTINREQLLLWNPDVIIVSSGKNRQNSIDDARYNSRFSGTKAMDDNAVYPCPIGAFWWDRPSPEAILGIMWLAKTLYPEAMADIDIKKETKWFFGRFYNYSLTDKEYESFGVEIKPKGAGRGSSR